MDHLAPGVVTTPGARPSRSSVWTRPAVVVVVNVLLGVPGVVPVFLTAIFLQEWPLASLGLTRPSSDEHDGVLVLILPIIGFALLAWLLTGFLLRRRLNRAGSAWFWPVSIAAALLPTIVLMGLWSGS